MNQYQIKPKFTKTSENFFSFKNKRYESLSTSKNKNIEKKYINETFTIDKNKLINKYKNLLEELKDFEEENKKLFVDNQEKDKILQVINNNQEESDNICLFNKIDNLLNSKDSEINTINSHQFEEKVNNNNINYMDYFSLNVYLMKKKQMMKNKKYENDINELKTKISQKKKL